MTLVYVVILVAIVVWAVMAFNRLIALKGQTLNGWKQIDVQLKRRHDLIPNLVNAVKGAMEFEKETLDAVISARNQAVKIQADTHPTGGVAALAQAAAALQRHCHLVQRPSTAVPVEPPHRICQGDSGRAVGDRG